jgi:hypothetical protein
MDRWWNIFPRISGFAPERSKGFSVSDRPNLPLAAIVGPDLDQVFEAPYTTLLKANAGAEVIKIEPRDDECLRQRALPGKTSPNVSCSLLWAAAAILTLLAIGPAGTTTAVAQQAGRDGTGNAGSAATEEETLVFFRHGEKPASGLGQLDCQGLNRSLKLPEVLISKFGRPHAIFAPDPAQRVKEPDQNSYYYVRPLATIEPTAIRLGLPVITKYGYADITSLESELLDPKHAKDMIFVSWEHIKLHEMVVDLVEKGGLPKSTVPEWGGSEFDRIDVVKLTREGQGAKVKYDKQAEGLNEKLPTTCP